MNLPSTWSPCGGFGVSRLARGWNQWSRTASCCREGRNNAAQGLILHCFRASHSDCRRRQDDEGEQACKPPTRQSPSKDLQLHLDNLRKIRASLGVRFEDGVLAQTSVLHATPAPLLVAIDTEYSTTAISEVGIAILDPRKLSPLAAGVCAAGCFRPIQASHWIVKGVFPRRPFLYGESRKTSRGKISKVLSDTFAKADGREVVLVGHGLRHDVTVVRQHLNYDLSLRNRVTMMIDTDMLVRHVSGGPPPDLTKLWMHLNRRNGIKSEDVLLGWHNAGNDAVCALQTLVLLVVTPESKWRMPNPDIGSDIVHATGT